MDGVAYIFLNRNGANGLGHVGGAFLMENGMFRCFATENPPGDIFVPAQYKGCWIEDCENSLDAVIATFQKSRTFTLPNGNRLEISNEYTEWKRLDVSDVYPELARAMLEKRRGEDYHLNDRNCENDVYDVLHDEEWGKRTGYGITANDANPIYVGWVQTSFGPKVWFDGHIGASDQGNI